MREPPVVGVSEPEYPARSNGKTVFTLGHGARPADELVACLIAAHVGTLVDVRRFPMSRRHPQFNRDALAGAVTAAGTHYLHLEELGGRRSGEPGEERFA